MAQMPASGAIAFSDLRSVFGTAASTPISSYYKGGSYVPNITANASVPTSGQVSMSNYYSARTVNSASATGGYSSYTSGSDTVFNFTSSGDRKSVV